MRTATGSAPDDAALDHLFAALGDPTRRAIVDRLTTSDATVSELAEPFAMTLPAVRKHLGVLEQAGVVTSRRVGRTRRCSLRVEALDEAEAWLADRRRFWTDALADLAAYVEDDEASDR